jgi:hypothetical protein
MGSIKLLAFNLLGLGFWILFTLKNPLDHHCNNKLLLNECIHHISSQRKVDITLESISLCISTVLYISLMNRNCVLLYLCVYGYSNDKYLLYYWVSGISLYISLLYLSSHFVPKIIWISGIKAGCS